MNRLLTMTAGRGRRRGTRRLVLPMLAAAALVLSGCGFQGLYSEPLPGGADLGDHPFTITAHFDNVLDLVPQSAVKVNDIPVGKVTAIALSGWKAKVTMQVNDSVKLPADAHAEVKQTSLLGEKYVSLEEPVSQPTLTASTKGPMLHNGSDIPISRTRSAAEVEQVLGALSLLLNQGGLSQIQVIARELNSALKGNEAPIRDLLNQLNTFVGTLDNQKSTITTALDNINTLAATLNRQKSILTAALDSYPAALKVLADERTKLVGLLSSLSKLGTVASRVITTTQTDTVTALKALNPVLTQLTAAGSDLPNALKIAGTFPFPLGLSRQFVKGDYANLSAVINLNLSDELCGILGNQIKALCTSTTQLLPSGKASSALTTTHGSSTQSMTPLILGAGG